MATSSVRAAESLLRFELFSFSRILFSASSFLLFLSCSTRKHLLLTRVAQSKFYCEFDSLLHRFYSSYHVQFPPPRKHLFLTRVAQSVVASLEEEIPHWRKLQKSSTGELFHAICYPQQIQNIVLSLSLPAYASRARVDPSSSPPLLTVHNIHPYLFHCSWEADQTERAVEENTEE